MRVLVTGAAGALGGASVDLLRAAGHDVLGLDLIGSGERILACDVRSNDSVAAAVGSAVDLLGGLDVLVNCAGVGYVQDSGHPPDDLALAVLDVNLLGTWRCTAVALPALVASRGRVVNVASLLSRLNGPFAAAYCASKRGVAAYSDVLRWEYGDDITVTTVHPGYVRTPIHSFAAGLGVSLDGMLPPDGVAETAAAIVRAATGRPRRDVVTNLRGRVFFDLGQHVPGLVDRVARARARRLAAAGRLPTGGLAEGLVSRLRGRGSVPRPPSSAPR